MKKINLTADDYMIIGTAREIKSLENKIRSRWESGWDTLVPVFIDRAKYNMTKMYGLFVEPSNEDGSRKYWEIPFTIVNADTVVGIIMDLPERSPHYGIQNRITKLEI